MPTYEYVCGNCGKKFSRTMTFAEHAKGAAPCPKCHGTRVAQQFSAVFTKTSRKS
jgi:putative FmdB family regulatory protein